MRAEGRLLGRLLRARLRLGVHTDLDATRPDAVDDLRLELPAGLGDGPAPRAGARRPAGAARLRQVAVGDGEVDEVSGHRERISRQLQGRARTGADVGGVDANLEAPGGRRADRRSRRTDVRLGADATGNLLAVGHEAYEQSSTLFEFAEQTTEATRHMYGAPNITTTHRLARLDVPTPRWMRAPGECPGMFALESAMDELAVLLDIDPVELRVRNDTQTDPESGKPSSSRHLVECLRRGAERFGWSGQDPRPGVRREGRWLVGNGVA